MISKANVVLTELNGLVKLIGILRLRNMDCIECLCPKIDDAVLKNKEYLQSLRLEWTEEAVGDEYDEMLLESLQQHKNLKNLKVCKSLPLFGCLPSLQYLKLESLTLLEYTEHASYDGYQFGMEPTKRICNVFVTSQNNR
ncbi:hypothetical protein CQW23_02900 [Capsicum baccatum]|uniref:R13L1/DRL21-like LRR repeat region domain-containing protein n=1 Tax=Capsicum baccatum TaxID=33114 RepID=A0A2G2XSR7_CAPBA|nr:hypothetical protein CQW23_02900 [Capsicum baccatum]